LRNIAIIWDRAMRRARV